MRAELTKGLDVKRPGIRARGDMIGIPLRSSGDRTAFLDCQIEEDALYTTAVASVPGNTQAIALVRGGSGIRPDECVVFPSAPFSRQIPTRSPPFAGIAQCHEPTPR